MYKHETAGASHLIPCTARKEKSWKKEKRRVGRGKSAAFWTLAGWIRGCVSLLLLLLELSAVWWLFSFSEFCRVSTEISRLLNGVTALAPPRSGSGSTSVFVEIRRRRLNGLLSFHSAFHASCHSIKHFVTSLVIKSAVEKLRKNKRLLRSCLRGGGVEKESLGVVWEVTAEPVTRKTHEEETWAVHSGIGATWSLAGVTDEKVPPVGSVVVPLHEVN